ncbi:MAG TPA: hypothetical protein PLJ88_05185 [Agitococcus sp.]|nr:hypothetical protein [Agitococcus sp.]
MKINCTKTNMGVTAYKVKATCKITGYSSYGSSNRLARVNTKWLLYSKMADRPFEDEKIKQVLGVRWFNKL